MRTLYTVLKWLAFGRAIAKGPKAVVRNRVRAQGIKQTIRMLKRLGM